MYTIYMFEMMFTYPVPAIIDCFKFVFFFNFFSLLKYLTKLKTDDQFLVKRIGHEIENMHISLVIHSEITVFVLHLFRSTENSSKKKQLKYAVDYRESNVIVCRMVVVVVELFVCTKKIFTIKKK